MSFAPRTGRSSAKIARRADTSKRGVVRCRDTRCLTRGSLRVRAARSRFCRYWKERCPGGADLGWRIADGAAGRGISLEAKQQTARTLMAQSADIYELNTVRKHLSGIKGGRLATVARGKVLTLAVSDVVGDDLSVIASGPTVADDKDSPMPSTSSSGAAVSPCIRGGRGASPSAARRAISRDAQKRRRAAGTQPRTRSVRSAAQSKEHDAPPSDFGYHVHVASRNRSRQIVRAGTYERRVADVTVAASTLCVISSGETPAVVITARRPTRICAAWHCACSRRWERK